MSIQQRGKCGTADIDVEENDRLGLEGKQDKNGMSFIFYKYRKEMAGGEVSDVYR